MKIWPLAAALFALAAPAFAQAPAPPQQAAPPSAVEAAGKKMLEDLKNGKADIPTRMAVAHDYVRYLTVNHQAAAAVEAGRADATKNAGKGTDADRVALLAALAKRGDNLGRSVAALSALHPGPSETDFVKNLKDLYAQDKGFYDELNRVANLAPGAATPNDAAIFERDTGLVLQIDHALLTVSYMIVLSLADPAGDAKHLRIAKADRDALVTELDSGFGPAPYKLDETNVPSAAAFLRKNLAEDFKVAE